MKKQKLTCEKARNISIVHTLGKLGHFPKRQTEKESWFLSPFRKETQASFKVSILLNRWYDHGEGKGGNIIDLITRISNCSVSEALDFLNIETTFLSFQQQPNIKAIKHEAYYEVLKIKKLENKALLEYIKARSISLDIAQKFCSEIYYKQNDKTYFAIAFKNDCGGFEVRNKYFKGCIGKKSITSIKNGSTSICVFEGFMDFLSYKTLYPTLNDKEDYIICNSTALIKQLPTQLVAYHTVYTCLDNDNSGIEATKFLKENHCGIFDGSILYIKHNDINDYLIQKVS